MRFLHLFKTAQRPNGPTAQRSRSLVLSLAALGLAALIPSSAHAQTVFLSEQAVNLQTDPTTVVSTSFEFMAVLLGKSGSDFKTATLTYPGPGSPVSYIGSGPLLDYSSGPLPTQAALDAAFPSGTYTTSYSGGTAGSGTVVSTLPASGLAISTPTFTADTFNGLQSLNASQPFTVSFNAFTGAQPTNSFVDFTIEDVTTAPVFNVFTDFLPSNTTSIVLPANTLLPGHSYSADLTFDNQSTPNPIGGGLDFRTVTGLDFTTPAPAVPEASTTVSLGLLLALGMSGVVIAAKRKKAA